MSGSRRMFDVKRDKTKSLPFGIFSLVFVASILVWQWFFVEEDICSPLTERLNHQGSYFLRWQDPELILLTSDKQQIIVSGDSEMHACGLMLERLKGQK